MSDDGKPEGFDQIRRQLNVTGVRVRAFNPKEAVMEEVDIATLDPDELSDYMAECGAHFDWSVTLKKVLGAIRGSLWETYRTSKTIENIMKAMAAQAASDPDIN